MISNILNPGCTACPECKKSSGGGSGGGGGGPPTPCTTGKITVCASQTCDAGIPGSGSVTAVSGVSVTITATSSPFSTFAGTTDSTGCFVKAGLPPGTYSVSALWGGVTHSGSVTIDGACDPASIAFTYGTSTLGFSVSGCGGIFPFTPIGCTSLLSGVSVTVVQSGSVVGTGTTDVNGQVFINLSRPTDGTNFTVTYSSPPDFHDLVVTMAGTRCGDQVGMSNRTSSVGTAAGGGVDATFGVCCYAGRPFPLALTATVPVLGTVTLTYSAIFGVWIGCAAISVVGYPVPGCTGLPSPAINQAFFVSWNCGLLSIATRTCNNGGLNSADAVLITCTQFALALSDISASQNTTTSSCSPLFSTGVLPAGGGGTLANVSFTGTWTVTP